MTPCPSARPLGRRIVSRVALAGAVAAVGAISASARADEPPSWQVVGTQGLVQIVIVPKEQEHDASAYKAQLAKLCPSDRTCFVNFYKNTSDLKAELPLPDAIAAEATARFRRSTKNGAELFQWSCRLAAGASATQCF